MNFIKIISQVSKHILYIYQFSQLQKKKEKKRKKTGIVIGLNNMCPFQKSITRRLQKPTLKASYRSTRLEVAGLTAPPE
jgi:hypothetical protein